MVGRTCDSISFVGVYVRWQSLTNSRSVCLSVYHIKKSTIEEKLKGRYIKYLKKKDVEKTRKP